MTLRVVEKIQAEKGGRKMVQAVSRLHLNAETRVRFEDSAFQIRGEQSGIEKFFLPLLQFSPVSIIPPLIHTYSSIYTLILPEGQPCDAWEPSNNAMLCRKSGNTVWKKTFIFV